MSVRVKLYLRTQMQTHTQEEGNGGNKLSFINKKLKKYTKSRNHPQANQTKYKGAQVKFKPKRETGKRKTSKGRPEGQTG